MVTEFLWETIKKFSLHYIKKYEQAIIFYMIEKFSIALLAKIQLKFQLSRHLVTLYSYILISVVESCPSSKSNLRVDHKWDSNLLSMKTLKTGVPFLKNTPEIFLYKFTYLGTKCLRNANHRHLQLSYLLCQPGIKNYWSFLYKVILKAFHTYTYWEKNFLDKTRLYVLSW